MRIRLLYMVFTLLPGISAASDVASLVDAIRGSDYASVARLADRSTTNTLLPDGSTPLSWAVETQDPRMVRLLLESGAKPDAARNAAAAPLLLACEHGDAEVLALLLDARPDVRRARADGIAPLAPCAARASTAILTRLLDAGAEVDHTDAVGQTALMHAAAAGRVDNLQLLLARGAAINRATPNGFTALFFALKSGNPAASMAMLQAGGDAKHVGPEGTTAVQLAMYQGDFAFAATMVERGGADLVALDRGGHNLLHAAVLAKQPQLVALLLARGADATAVTGRPRVEWRYEANFKTEAVQFPPKSARQLAAESDHDEIRRLLAARTARSLVASTVPGSGETQQ